MRIEIDELGTTAFPSREREGRFAERTGVGLNGRPKLGLRYGGKTHPGSLRESPLPQAGGER